MSENGDYAGAPRWAIGAAGTLVCMWTIITYAPKCLRALLRGMKSFIDFNNAIPEVLRLPKTLEEHKKRFDDQDAILKEIRSDLKSLKSDNIRIQT